MVSAIELPRLALDFRFQKSLSVNPYIVELASLVVSLTLYVIAISTFSMPTSSILVPLAA